MSPTKEVCYCMKPVLASLWQTSPEKLPLADYYFFTDICHQPLLSSVCTDPLQELKSFSAYRRVARSSFRSLYIAFFGRICNFK